MVSDDVVAMTALMSRATYHILGGSIMADHVEGDGREVFDLVTEVAGDRERLEKNLGHDDGGSDIQHNAALKLRDNRGKLLEVDVARFAEHAAVRRRVLMNDVRADGDVD